jgi:hypothetical protein
MYNVAGKLLHPDDPNLNDALASIYGTTTRPLCLCKNGGIEMYIAKLNNKYILKRMPNTGSSHAINCESYEPPAELSGRGEVIDSAVQTDAAEGITNLKLDFALTRTGSRTAPVSSNTEHDSVRTDGKKLTLRGTLHYLYDEAGLNRWYPAMAGKRSWWVVRKYLREAAADKKTKGNPLANLLYIPESFSQDRKEEIAERRQALFRSISQVSGTTKKLMIIIAELTDIGEARFGKKMVFKHLYDCPFFINEDVYKRFTKRFDKELAMRSVNDDSHLLVIGTFSVNAVGTAMIEEASVMLVNKNWIPFESTDEKMLIEHLTEDKRKFVKGLRYNLPSNKVLASCVLNDTEKPVALYLVPFGSDELFKKEMQELINSSEIQSWVWNTSSQMPALPPVFHHPAR